MSKYWSKLKNTTWKIKLIIFNIIHFRGIRKHSYLNSKDTIKYLLANNKSLIRWGDGESSILFGRPIHFQESNKELSNSLKEIIKTYSSTNSNFLLAAPSKYLEASIFTLLKNKKLIIWLRTRYIFGKLISKESILGDAFIFRPLSTLKNNEIEKLWLGFNIIFVHPEQAIYLDFKKKYPQNKVKFVKINDKNAFSNIDSIMQEIKEIIKDKEFERVNTKILICAGPSAKVLIYELSALGYTCYDLGHYFKWKFYGKTNQKGI